MPQICRRLRPGFGLRLRLSGSPRAAEKGFSPNLWTLPPRYDKKSHSFSDAYRRPSDGNFEFLSLGRRGQLTKILNRYVCHLGQSSRSGHTAETIGCSQNRKITGVDIRPVKRLKLTLRGCLCHQRRMASFEAKADS